MPEPTTSPAPAARRCRLCGCTDAAACVTAAGPCHWVAPDLCSACAPHAKPRERLAERLKPLEAAIAAIEKQIDPFQQVLGELHALRDLLVEESGCGDLVGRCEACDAVLFEGDPGFRYEDGPLLCAAHAPTHADLLAESEEHLADVTAADPADADEIAAAQAVVDDLKARLAAGTPAAAPCTFAL